MSSLRRRVVLSTVLVLSVATAQADDSCMGKTLNAVGVKESGLIRCHRKVARTGDASGLAACEAKVIDKVSHLLETAGACVSQTRCEAIADACSSSVAGAFIESFPSACEAAKLKAAAKFLKGELRCYAKTAARGLPVDRGGCLAKATSQFSAAITREGTCPDGGSPQTLLESKCVQPVINTDGSGRVTDVCGTLSSLPCTAPGAPCGTCGSGECLWLCSGAFECVVPEPTPFCFTDQDCAGFPRTRCLDAYGFGPKGNECIGVCSMTCQSG